MRGFLVGANWSWTQPEIPNDVIGDENRGDGNETHDEGDVDKVHGWKVFWRRRGRRGNGGRNFLRWGFHGATGKVAQML